MSQKRKRSRQNTPESILLRYCGQLNEDDQVDPREYFKERISKKQRKTLQLCKQVNRTLALALGEFDDEVLQSLLVIGVEPAPNASQMLVVVQSDSPDATPLVIRNRLQEIEGVLRTAVASAINRKKTPKLLFQVIVKPS